MITVTAGIDENGVYSNMHYDGIETPSQFEDEAEAILWNILMFMSEHSELNEREILLSLVSDLDDHEGEPPFSFTAGKEEVIDG